MKRLLLTVTLVTLVTLAAVGYCIWGPAHSPATTLALEEEATTEGALVAIPVALDPLDPTPVREVVEPPPAPKEPPKLPWDPSVLVMHPYWTIPTDLKQNMHWHLNNSSLMRGELVPSGYDRFENVARDVAANPDRIALTEAEAEQLAQLLADDRTLLQEMGKEEWRLKGIAFHEAVERGDYAYSGGSSTTPQFALGTEEGRKSLMQPVKDQDTVLRERFGKPFKDFCTTVISGPPPSMGNYTVYITRAHAEKSFLIYEQVTEVQARALGTARDFFRGLHR